MVPAVILGVALLLGGFLIARWWVRAEPRQIVVALRWVAIVVAAAILIALAIGRQWSWLWAGAIFLLPLLRRWRAMASWGRNAQGPSPGGRSGVETGWFEMELDHDTGEMDGEVRLGRFAGRRLSALQLDDHVVQWRECAGDEASRRVLEAWLDRRHGDVWRRVAGEGAGPGEGTASGGAGMTVEEARSVLGVGPGASRDDIEQAWRKVMKSAHPDQGGSDWLAAKVNQAKELLLSCRL
ncbi:MAG: molecular chaperone DnaJ [Alphaproteobacteria bacterium]|nr:molecular chaperone DnaJ [Alphaproteobacteria bacterium]